MEQIQTDKKENNGGKHKKLGVLAVLLTFFIIILLVLTGPAYALSMNLSSDKTDVKRGESISFDVDLNLDSNQYLDMGSITLVLEGPLHKECVFSKTGSIINGCDGVSSIVLVSKTNGSYGYGYGYGYGSFTDVKYRVVINTASYAAGTYITQIKALIGNSLYTKTGNSIVIRSTSGTTTFGGISSIHNPFDNGIGDGSSGNKVYLQESDNFNFMLDNEQHTLQVLSITNDSVTLVIRSEPQQVIMTIYKDEQVDVNDDGKSDLDLSLLYTGETQASLAITYPQSIKLNKEVKKIESKNSNYLSDEGFIQNSYSESPPYATENNVYELFFGNGVLGGMLFIIILVFINLIMLELIAFASVSMKRKRNKVRIKRYI